MPLRKISTLLEQEGIIRNREVFIGLVTFLGKKKEIKAGEYEFHTPMLPLEVLNSLVKELRFITRSKTSVYNKCRKLDGMGLVRLVRGYPCLILPREDVAGAVVWKIVDATDRKLGISRERMAHG